MEIYGLFSQIRFISIYYPTAPRRVQIMPKMSANITRYLYSRRPVRQVCLLLTNQLGGFPVQILFRLAYFCHAFPENKCPRNSPTRTQNFGMLDNKSLVLLCSIAENFYSLFVS